MSEHTPGPWRIWKVGSEHWCICEPDNPRRHSHFATVQVGNMWHDEGKANARLIAAAPDLLAACERLLRAEAWSVTADRMDSSADRIALLTAAINKATGQS